MRDNADEERTLTSRPAGVPAAGHTFASQEIVGGRFRILRLLGQGGMGEVYEAEDLDLHEHVALKAIRPEIAGDERTIARFRREIQLARKVTHPNVCRLFDVAYHSRGDQELTFLTMELLAGESLADRLRRQGPMTDGETLEIIEQVASGLAAAHRAGVVHRDLKCSNIMLAPGNEAEGGVRAVITDFGIAHSPIPRRAATSEITASGDFLGTPAYMAPEQLEGEETTSAADIYSLGVVMYEMVTGLLPFTGPTPLAAALKRLRERAPSPRAHNAGLDAKFEAAILRCLERNPKDRFASALDLVDALRGGTRAVSPGSRSRRRTLAGAAILILVLGIIAGIYSRRYKRESAGFQARRSVAVIGFKNLTRRAETDWLSTALADMVSTELAAGQKLRTIPGESVARMKLELALADTDSYSRETLGAIRRGLSADYVVVGSYTMLGERVRLDLRLQDAKAGETIAAVTETGREADLLTLVSRTGVRLREGLGAGGLTGPESAEVRAASPGSLESQRLYAAGLARLRVFDALTARALLEKAAHADPRHPLIRSALAAAWSALGYDAKAAEEGRKAFELAGNLRREDRLWVEGLFRELSKEWGRAIEIYRTLWNFFPDNPEYGLRLASAQTSGGRAQDALVTVAELRKMRGPATEDPRIDLAQVAANEMLTEVHQARAGAEGAAAKSAAQGARLLMARARLAQARAHNRLNEIDEMLSAAEEARRIYAGAGDRAGVASAMNLIATVLSLHGKKEEAKQMNREALWICREIGDQRCIGQNLNNLGIILKDQAEYASARKMQEEALRIRRETGDKLNEASTLNNLAVLMFEQSDLAGAKTFYQQGLAVSREIGDKRGVARSLLNMALVLEQEGDLAGAKKNHEESLAIRRQTGERRSLAVALLGLGTVLLPMGELAAARKMGEESLELAREAGDRRGEAFALTLLGRISVQNAELGRARKLYEEALAIRQKIGEKASIADSRIWLSYLDLEEQQAGKAFGAIQALMGDLRKMKRSLMEVQADLLMASILLAQGEHVAAERKVEEARAISARIGYGSLSLESAITRARIRAAVGKHAEAMRDLDQTIAQAGKRQNEACRLEAALARGELESADGSSRLDAVEREARAKGFGLIAAKARAKRAGARL